MKHVALIAVALLCLPRVAQAQTSPSITSKQDVIYGRVEGSALLADIAYPDGGDRLAAVISVHGGRWRAGNRTDASSIKVDCRSWTASDPAARARRIPPDDPSRRSARR